MSTISLKELFSVDLEGAVQPRALKDALPYPEKNEHFVFEPSRVAKLMRFFAGQSARNNLMLIGPAGAGKTAVFTTDAGQRWANAWTEWENYDRFFSQMIRWAMRPVNEEGKFSGREFNLVATKIATKHNSIMPGDTIVGDAFLVGLDDIH